MRPPKRRILSVTAERLDLDARIRDVQASEQLEHPHDHAGCPADVVDWIRQVARGFLDESAINSPGRTGPLRVGIAGEGVEDAESGVLFFQRIEFESLHDLEPRRR